MQGRFVSTLIESTVLGILSTVGLGSQRFLCPWQGRVRCWLACLALWLGGCGVGVEAPPAVASGPDVILISLDTYRWDALGLNRSESGILTPNLDRFGRDAVNFTGMFAQMPHTLPSHASMFTGLYPDVHRALTNTSPLPASIPTLAEVLALAGYRTVGFTSCTWFKEKFGLAQGFETYEVISNLDHYTFAAEINDMAFELFETLPKLTDPGRRPLFLFLHYYDAHSDIGQDLPYWAPEAYRLGINGSDGRFCDPAGNCATEYLQAADRHGRDLSSAEIEDLRRLYLSGIRYLDHQLGQLFQRLREAGLSDNSLTIITADHGEEFREHGRFIHAQAYDETMRVPLLVRFPGGEYSGATVSALVESTDILPTILDVLDLPAPSPLQGRSLLAVLAGHSDRQEVIVQGKERKHLYGLRTAEYKLLHDFATGATELYDLRTDLRERNDLAGSQPEIAKRLRRRLIRRITENREFASDLGPVLQPGTTELTVEEVKRLKALGYVGQ